MSQEQLSEKQLNILEKFQEQVQSYFDFKFGDIFQEKEYYTNIDSCIRFLSARDWNTEKSQEMWKEWVQWRKTYQPHNLDLNEPIYKKLHETGKLYWHKHDKNKYPIMYYRMKFHVKGSATAEQHFRYLIYMIDKGVEQSDVLGSGKISVIYDRRQHGESDPVSMEVSKMLTPVLQNYYPERLNTFFVLGPNLFFRMSYKVISIFMSEKTRRKAKLLAGNEELLEFIDKENLLEDYGGTSVPSKSDDMIYKQDKTNSYDQQDVLDQNELDEFNKQLQQ